MSEAEEDAEENATPADEQADTGPDEDAEEAPASESKPAPRKRKKKKKRKKRSESEASEPDTGIDRPGFLLDFPADPELDRLVTAFEAGNYALVRDEAPKLAEKTEDPRIRDAALELRRRIDPDPLARYLVLASAGLFLFLVLWTYFGHGGHGH